MSDVLAASRAELLWTAADAELATHSPAPAGAMSRHFANFAFIHRALGPGSGPRMVFRDNAIELESGRHALPIAGDVASPSAEAETGLLPEEDVKSVA